MKYGNLLKAAVAFMLIGLVTAWLIRPDPELYQWTTVCQYSEEPLPDTRDGPGVIASITNPGGIAAAPGRYAVVVAPEREFFPRAQAGVLLPGFGYPLGTRLPATHDQHLLVYECGPPSTWEYRGETTLHSLADGQTTRVSSLQYREWAEIDRLVPEPASPPLTLGGYPPAANAVGWENNRRTAWGTTWLHWLADGHRPQYRAADPLGLTYQVVE